VASVDPHQQVSYRGQELYKKRAADVNLEDATAVRTLMEIFLGTQGTALPDEARVVAAALPLKVKLMNMFCKSEAAANAFPSAVQVSSPPPPSSSLCLSVSRTRNALDRDCVAKMSRVGAEG
jgi:hypothetical protein